MTKEYTLLPTCKLEPNAHFQQPPQPPAIVHVNDPALHIVVDFAHAHVPQLNTESKLPEAEKEMQFCHAHFFLVVNSQNTIVGLLGSEDILGEKPLQIAQTRRLAHADIPVRLLMTPVDEIVALDIQELRHAKVEQVLATLIALQKRYAFVIEIHPNTHQQTVCGLISFLYIRKKVGEKIMDDFYQPHTIAQLQQQLHRK